MNAVLTVLSYSYSYIPKSMTDGHTLVFMCSTSSSTRDRPKSMIFISESTAAYKERRRSEVQDSATGVIERVEEQRSYLPFYIQLVPFLGTYRGVQEVLRFEVAVANVVHGVAVLDGAQHVADDKGGILRGIVSNRGDRKE